MRDIYPELAEKQQHTTQTILGEEKRFESTLNSGLSLLDDAVQKAKSDNQKEIPSEDRFQTL